MRTLVPAIFMAFLPCFAAFSQVSEPLVYFKQDFCDPGLVFQNNSPNTGQVDHVLTSSSAAVTLNNCFLEASRTEPTGGGSVRIIRTSPFDSPAPQSLHALIELEVTDITQEGTIAAYFGIGDGLPTSSTLIANALLFSKLSIDFKSDGAYNLRISGSSGAILSDPLYGKIAITWAMNNSGSTISYFSPLKTEVTLEPGKFDIWIDNHHWINGADRISEVNLNNFAFILSNGVGTVRLHHIEISNNGFQLPLILTRFKAERRLYEALIHWEMAPEHTASDFIIERSTGGAFEIIGSVNVPEESREQTRFSFVDPSPETGLNYYRLKMIGFDGEIKYSPIEVVRFEPSEPVITIAPNPSAPEKISLLAANVNPESLELYNITGGRMLFSHSYDPSGMVLSLYPSRPLTSGFYFLKLLQGEVLKTVKVMIP